MIELFEQDERTNDRQSSKGNQLKWENNGFWYKADYTGYEGLSEYMISHLLRKSTLKDMEYVIYDIEKIKYRSTIYTGVKSKNFLKAGWQIMTIERLYKNFSGRSLYRTIYSINSHEERLSYLVNQVERITGLKDFGKYMNKLFTIDAFFLNEDRHLHNIAVLMNGNGEFMYCPIFDNGAGLLADTKMDYPLNGEVSEYINQVDSKTICFDFEEQLDLSEKLYGSNLGFLFQKKDVDRLLEEAEGYSKEEYERVEAVIAAQMRKYQYLFC